MKRKLAIHCIFGTSYIINTAKIQGHKIRQRICWRWMQTEPPKSQVPEKWGRSLWNNLFGKYLLTTNTISAGILMVAGDALSQEIEYRRGASRERYDLFRLGRMFLVGTLQGPLHHFFYKWMDDAMPKPTMKTTTSKILLDQLLMSPACILLFFYPACLLEKKTLAESNDEIRRKFLTVYMADWMIWPAAQFVNFHYLDPKYRVIFVNVVTMMYNIFLSYVKHHDMEIGVDKIENAKCD